MDIAADFCNDAAKTAAPAHTGERGGEGGGRIGV